MKIALAFCLMFAALPLRAQDDGSPTFNALRDAIKPSVPEGYALNTGQTFDNRFQFQIAYDRGSDGSDRLIYGTDPKSDGFTEMNQMLATEEFEYEGRQALFQDGSKTGMSGIVLMLKNGAGKFTLTHRALGGTARDKDALLNILSTVQLMVLETAP